LLTRISYHVGRPWMFDGKTFFPDTGIPMRKIACISRLLALADPVPLTVAILKAKSVMADMIRLVLRTGLSGRISACPTRPSDTARRTDRSGRTHLRP